MSIAALDGSSRPIWRTSSYSNGAGGECVKCALTDDRTLVRDSKSADGPEITVGSGAWLSFIRSVKHGAEG
ncbi:DUF397 domain-containing protein [Streptomyces sp. NPDC058755]|uniref:DUF397 domain-containing protein n=1 Tax=unclassified Streptomyces TaxID=2593676 RepID=UPI0036A69541